MKADADVPTGDLASETRDLLWHYTDTRGLLGILNNKVLWATDALYLNDSRELLEAHELQVKTLLADDPWSAGETQLTFETFHRWWLHDIAKDLQPLEGVFVASFCAVDDLLSQWRGYGAGPGYAIGFAREDLTSWAARVDARLVRVTYGSPDEELAALLRPRSVKVRGTGEAFVDSEMADVASLKHPAFAEEHEWRVVANGDSRELKFRGTRRGLAPYVELPLDLALISEIKLGPGLSQGTAVRAVERILTAKGASAPVSTSKVPFRT